MQPVLAFLRAHGPAMLAFAIVVLPGLITGLSRYPKASGLVTGLRVVLDVLSVVSHADSPGTFKMPLTRSQDPERPREFDKLQGLPPIALLPAAFGAMFLGGCMPDESTRHAVGFIVGFGLAFVGFALAMPLAMAVERVAVRLRRWWRDRDLRAAWREHDRAERLEQRRKFRRVSERNHVAPLAFIAFIMMASSIARADAPPPVLADAVAVHAAMASAAAVKVPPVVAQPVTVAPPAPAPATQPASPDQVKQALAVLQGINAGSQQLVSGVQAFAPFAQTTAGKFLIYAGAGCIIATTVLITGLGTYETLKPSAGASPMPTMSGLTVARW